MRAKLAGFRFWLADGVLKALQLEEAAYEFVEKRRFPEPTVS
jgi:hypothetical protein